MKLFQALLVVTAIIFFQTLVLAPTAEKAVVFSKPLDVSLPAAETRLSVSDDSLQKRFERAVWSNDVSSIREMIELDVDVDKINPDDGYAALHWAVERNLFDAVKVLIEGGTDVNLFTHNAVGNDRTALHIASELGHVDIVRHLLEKGADPNLKTVYGESPLHGVRLFVKIKEIVQLLIEYGADVNAANEFGTTPLHAASLLGSTDIAELLIEHGADVNRQNKRGLTPLHHAAQQGNVKVARALIAANANVEAQTRTGDTAMHLAVKNGHSEIIRMLLERGANPLTLNNFSKSPLSEARERADDQIIEIMSTAASLDREG